MQYVACTFAGGGREYTFEHDDGVRSLYVGDKVEVDTARGPTVAFVSRIVEGKPPFATRPVLRVIERADAREARKAAEAAEAAE